MIDAHDQAIILIALPVLAVLVFLAISTAIAAAIYAHPRPKVKTVFWAKPIPARSCDWHAWYDGDEPDDDGRMRRIGEGATEREAVDDLLTNHPHPEARRLWIAYRSKRQPREASSIISAFALVAFMAAIALLIH
jgi:hypothetical protein